MRLRYWVGVWMLVTLVFGIAGFVDSNWASRYDPLGRCGEVGRVGYDFGPDGRVSTTRTIDRTVKKRRFPPGVQCRVIACSVRAGHTETCRNYSVVANASLVDWLVLFLYSAAYGAGITVALILLRRAVIFSRRGSLRTG